NAFLTSSFSLGDDWTTASAARWARSKIEQRTLRGFVHAPFFFLGSAFLHASHSLQGSLRSTIWICGASHWSRCCPGCALKTGSSRLAWEPTLSMEATRVPSESVSML